MFDDHLAHFEQHTQKPLAKSIESVVAHDLFFTPIQHYASAQEMIAEIGVSKKKQQWMVKQLHTLEDRAIHGELSDRVKYHGMRQFIATYIGGASADPLASKIAQATHTSTLDNVKKNSVLGFVGCVMQYGLPLLGLHQAQDSPATMSGQIGLWSWVVTTNSYNVWRSQQKIPLPEMSCKGALLNSWQAVPWIKRKAPELKEGVSAYVQDFKEYLNGQPHSERMSHKTLDTAGKYALQHAQHLEQAINYASLVVAISLPETVRNSQAWNMSRWKW